MTMVMMIILMIIIRMISMIVKTSILIICVFLFQLPVGSEAPPKMTTTTEEPFSKENQVR